MPLPKGVSKKAKKSVHQHQQRIHLPRDAMAEVFKCLPRSQRAQLALMGWQTAEAIIPAVNADRQKVSPIHTPSTLTPTITPHPYSRS